MIIQNRRTFFLILVGLAIVLLTGLVIFVSRALDGDEVSVANESTPFTQPSAAIDSDEPAIQIDPAEHAAQSLARTFVERIGSYSNQSNYQNIDDLADVMTPRVKTWAESLKTVAQDDEYKGVTTRGLSMKTISFEDKRSAVIEVSAQREYSAQQQEDTIEYQKAQVHVIYSSGKWLVDGIFWQE